MKFDSGRRAWLKISGFSAAILPFSFLIKSGGCTIKDYDVVISFKATAGTSVLKATLSHMREVQFDWNEFKLDGQEYRAKYVFSINGMWADWVYEVNGQNILLNASDYYVKLGDEVTWKGKFHQ